MPPYNSERLTGAEADFAIAVHELRQVTGALRDWQSGGGESANPLDDLHRSLDRIIEVDERIVEARKNRDIRLTDWKSIDDEYARGLREAIETVQSLATQLDADRIKLCRGSTPTSSKEKSAAYSRALSQQ